jgi:hypothetical protein
VPGAPLPSTTRLPPPAAPGKAAPPRMVPAVPAAAPPPSILESPVTPLAPSALAPPVASPAQRAGLQPQLQASGPVNIFADEAPVEKPHDDLPTLFAEELISEKSLDEVILAFLSADLEPPR